MGKDARKAMWTRMEHGRQAFITAIRTRPSDILLRLVFADWLEEAGTPSDSAWAELIRLQCGYAGRSAPSHHDVATERRESELLGMHQYAWAERLWVNAKAIEVRFRHGFPEIVRTSARDLVAAADTVVSLTPLHALTVDDPADQLEPLLGHLVISNLKRLKLYGPIEEGDMAVVASSSQLDALEDFEASCGPLRPAQVGDLSRARFLRTLVRLAIPDSDVGDHGVKCLLDNLVGGSLASLDLQGNGLGPSSAITVSNFRPAKGLTELNISGNAIGNEGCAALASSPRLRRLRSLDISSCSVGEAGIRSIVRSPYLQHLRELRFLPNHVSPDVAASLRGCRQGRSA